VLRVSELGVRFPSTVAVDSVSFSIDRGEILALVGESGSGKTVTAHAVLGLLPSSATARGSVQLTDDPVERPAHEAPNLLAGGSGRSPRSRPDAWAGVRGRLAAMEFQEPQTALNPVKTVGWQLAEALRAHRVIGRRWARSRAVGLLTLLGFLAPRCASTHGARVSVQAELLSLLGELRYRLCMAVLLITHNMWVVADLADRVLVMRDSQPFTDYTRHVLGSVPRLRVVESAAPSPIAPPGRLPNLRPRPP